MEIFTNQVKIVSWECSNWTTFSCNGGMGIDTRIWTMLKLNKSLFYSQTLKLMLKSLQNSYIFTFDNYSNVIFLVYFLMTTVTSFKPYNTDP